jgi:hypothetical protein
MTTDVEPARRRFRVGEYHRLPQTGVLKEDDRVEPIRGEIAQAFAIGYAHPPRVARPSHVLLERLRGRRTTTRRADRTPDAPSLAKPRGGRHHGYRDSAGMTPLPSCDAARIPGWTRVNERG